MATTESKSARKRQPGNRRRTKKQTVREWLANEFNGPVTMDRYWFNLAYEAACVAIEDAELEIESQWPVNGDLSENEDAIAYEEARLSRYKRLQRYMQHHHPKERPDNPPASHHRETGFSVIRGGAA